MAIIYKRVLANAIIDEREGRGYKMDGNDKDVLKRMCDEINESFPDHPYKYHYLAEIRMIDPPAGVSSILLKYIHQFESESCRAVLVSSILYDKPRVKGLDRIFMDLYNHFRASSYYMSTPSTAHICLKYDNAFSKLKSSKISSELVALMKYRREVYILPFTAIMIARKWAPKELGEIMSAHLMNKNVTRTDVGILKDGDYPSLEVIVRETTFTAIECLLYYPSEENLKVIMEYTNHPYKELAKFASETVEKMKIKLSQKTSS